MPRNSEDAQGIKYEDASLHLTMKFSSVLQLLMSQFSSSRLPLNLMIQLLR